VNGDTRIVGLEPGPKRYRMLVFDWDGTLMDSTGLIVSSIQSACRDLALPVPDDARARYIIGLGLQDAMEHLLPGLAAADYPKVSERYRYHFLTRDHEAPLFEGVPGMLAELKQEGYRLAVATGKSRAGLNRAWKHTGLLDMFHTSRCADESVPKPHPAMLHELIEETGVEAAQMLMIGDTTHDLQMAANAGVEAVAVTYGAHDVEELKGHAPLACVDSVSDLLRWIRSAA
jgi:phosphoglycolate phosphatase